MGWQDLHPQIRKAYQSKGGSAKVAKGFATMNKDRHQEVSSQGGKKKYENLSKKDTYEELNDYRRESIRLEDVLSILGEDDAI